MIGERCAWCGELIEVTTAQYKKINSGKEIIKKCKKCGKESIIHPNKKTYHNAS